jgi:hypothetical protein
LNLRQATNGADADLILPFRYWKKDKFVYKGVLVLVQLKNRKVSSLMWSKEVSYELIKKDEIPKEGSPEYPSIVFLVGSDSFEDSKDVQINVRMQIRTRSSNQENQKWLVGIILGYSNVRFLTNDLRKEFRKLATSKLRLESELLEKAVPLTFKNSAQPTRATNNSSREERCSGIMWGMVFKLMDLNAPFAGYESCPLSGNTNEAALS